LIGRGTGDEIKVGKNMACCKKYKIGIEYAYGGSGVRLEWECLGESGIGKLYSYINYK
jgi:hypothetical protein